MIARLLALAILTAVTACASYRMPVADPARPPAPFQLRLDMPPEVVVRDLTGLAAASEIFRVESVDPEAGRVVLALTGSEPAMFVDCGTYSPGVLGDPAQAGPFVDSRVRTAGGRLEGVLTATALRGEEATELLVDGRYRFSDRWNRWSFDSNQLDVQRTVTGSAQPGRDRPRAGPERGCRSTRVAARLLIDFLAARDSLYRRQRSFDDPGVAPLPPPKSDSITVLAGSWGELAGRASACGVPDNAIDSFRSRAHRAIDARDGRGWVRREAAGLYRAGFDKERGQAEGCDLVLRHYHEVATAL